MKAARALPVVLAAAALAGLLAGTIAEVPRAAGSSVDDGTTRFYSGLYSPADPVMPAYVTLAYGQYQLGYSMDVRLASPQSDLVLRCGFADPNGIVGYLERGTPTIVTATGRLTRIEYTGSFRLPEVTVAVRCVPSRVAQLRVSFTNIAITINKRV